MRAENTHYRNESSPLQEQRDLERDVSQVWPNKDPSKKHLESWEPEADEASGSQGGTEAASAPVLQVDRTTQGRTSWRVSEGAC